MRNSYAADRQRLGRNLIAYETKQGRLLGIEEDSARAALIEQLIDSEQRVLYTTRLRTRGVDPASIDPRDPGFDPIRGAIHHAAEARYDEAVWMIFLFVHFGKHRVAGWRYIRDIYGRLGTGEPWSWEAVSSDVTSFRFWLDEHKTAILARPGPRGFGNHRKYESLDAWSESGTGAVVESYVEWVHASGNTHKEKFASFTGEPTARFDAIYRSMKAVRRFGRTARFDYLTMLSKLSLLDIEPPHGYIKHATGPLRGAGLLFHGDRYAGIPSEMERATALLAAGIGVSHNVLEDAICNWQKNPDEYVRFSG